MAKIISIGTGIPPYHISQDMAMEFARRQFSSSFKDIERLLKVFVNSEISSRNLVKPVDWYGEKRTFAEKNDIFLYEAVHLGKKAIQQCMVANPSISYEEIEAIFMINTTGIATPSLEAYIMNHLPFSSNLKRIPIWGLGCAGGASGLSRAGEYCKAFPNAKVLVLSIELCSLTFQKDDVSKSNLIGTSLFGDGAACALVVGDEAGQNWTTKTYPTIICSQSTFMKDTLDVMGWRLQDTGLHVVFSKNIPSIVKQWLRPMIDKLLQQYHITIHDITHFIAHPGGKKVIQAYEEALGLTKTMTSDAKEVLKAYGNMSSATIFYVLQRFLLKDISQGDWGIATALGPGFSSELLLLKWQ